MCILGAGLLCGTALAIAIPEGVSLLQESYRGEDCDPGPEQVTQLTALTSLPVLYCLNSIILPCRPTTGSGFHYLPGPGDSGSGAYRLGSNFRFHPHVCGGSDQHLFVLTRPVGFIFQNATLTVRISVGSSNSVCLVSGLKGVNITATVGLVIHAAGTDHCCPHMCWTPAELCSSSAGQEKPQINCFGFRLHAADGFALGAAAATGQVTVQVVIFLAVILHKVRWPLRAQPCEPVDRITVRLCRLVRRPQPLVWSPF